MVGVWIIEQKVPYLVVLLFLLEIVRNGNAAATALGGCCYSCPRPCPRIIPKSKKSS